jgi:AcrR family transcriptional regulator
MGEGRFDALLPSAVAERAELSTRHVHRAFANRQELAAGMYRMGQERIVELCRRTPRTAMSGFEAVIELAYDLIEQAASDPLVRAVHVLGLTEQIRASGLDSVYRLWEQQFTALLAGGGGGGSRGDAMVAADDRQVSVVVGVLVDAVARLSTAYLPLESAGRFDRVHLVLTSVLPALCSTDQDAVYLRQYLSRVREHASIGVQ